MIGAAAAVAHPGRAPAVEHDARGQCMGAHREIVAAHRRPQVGIGGAAAPPAAHRHVQASESFLLKAIDVVGQRVARLARGGKPGLVQRIGQQPIARVQLADGAPVLIAAIRAPLRAPEVRQQLAIAPACGPLRFPMLIVERVAAHVHQTIDRR